MALVLDNIRVLDMSRFMAAPLCAMLLADMGAEVIRIEEPRGGIDRAFSLVGPDGETLSFKALQRGKKGITLRLDTEKGKQIFGELVKGSDVVLHNYVPGTEAARVVDYDDMKQINSRIIVAAVTAYGQNGPYAEQACMDYAIQGRSGGMTLTGSPNDSPVRAAAPYADYATAIGTALGIVLALYHREKTGMGQFIDVALFDMASFLTQALGTLLCYTVYGKEIYSKWWKPVGNHGWATYMNCLKAKDGQVMICPASTGLWRRLAKVVGGDNLATDSRFKDDMSRAENFDILDPIIAEWVAQRTVNEVISTLQEAKVPCAPVRTPEQLLDDPQVKARDMIIHVDHPELGRIPVPGVPIKLSLTPGRVGGLAPKLGEDNEEVYGEVLGFSPDKLLTLKQEGII